jgi:hypothetical protein
MQDAPQVVGEDNDDDEDPAGSCKNPPVLHGDTVTLPVVTVAENGGCVPTI